jgi:1-acyl-sn-glycerol-3-phosphate acyltransferase
MLLSGQEYVDEYATSMKDRIVRAAKVRARELQEAARPGSAAKELEEALDAAEGSLEKSDSPVDNVAIGEEEAAEDRMAANPGERAAS